MNEIALIGSIGQAYRSKLCLGLAAMVSLTHFIAVHPDKMSMMGLSQ